MDKDERILIKKIDNYLFKYCDMLGQGNFSKVYKAYHQKTNEKVAIKVIELNSLKSPKLEELLFSEIDVLKKLNHTNVLRCYEVFTSNRNCYIITQFCNGGDLDEQLRKKGRYTEQQALSYIKDIFNGLKYLAQNKIIHRDLKIANIFLHDGIAKIADFGFAKITNSNFKDINIGSPLYMSPEALIYNTYGQKTDVWAFGILVYQLLHGKTPHSFCKTEAQLRKEIKIPITSKNIHPQISKELKEVIIRCLQIDEQKRPTINELKQFQFFQRLKNNTTVISLGPRKLSTAKIQFRRQDGLFSRDQGRATSLNNRNYLQLKRENGQIRYSENPNGIKELDRPKFHSIYKNGHQFQSTKTPLSPTNSKKWERKSTYNFFQGVLSFKQCINLLHYCRLMYKYIILMRETQHILSECERVLSFWIFRIINAINQKIESKQIIFEDTTGSKEKKLKEVTEEYERRYALDIEKPIVLETNFTSLQSILRMKCKQIQSLRIVRHDQRYVELLHFLIVLIEGTNLLGKCWKQNNYKEWREYRRIESFLIQEKHKLTEESYVDLKNKIW